jgi:putative ABC transport system permease protein
MLGPLIRHIKILPHSLQAAMSYKIRAFFCVLSVALGVASITIIVASTEGAYKKANEFVERFGPDSLLILSGSPEARAIGLREKTLTFADVDALKGAFSTAYVIIPMISASGVTISYGDKKTQSRIIGSDNNYTLAWSWQVLQGSNFTEDDIKSANKVGLMGNELHKNIFGNENPIGKYIIAGGIPVKIVGLLKERGTTASGTNIDDRLIMPITTVMKKIKGEKKYISSIRLRFLDQKNLSIHKESVRQLLRQRHRIQDDIGDDFRIISPDEIIKFLVALTGSLILFLGIVGIISLVVSGFVLANLFLLSVSERRQEIGIRRAMGARKTDILFQFLEEAVILTCSGGILGFLLGLAGSRLLTYLAEFPIHFSYKAFLGGMLLAILIGVSFGLHPARKAAGLDPIHAIKK